jgi:hypothetical protein
LVISAGVTIHARISSADSLLPTPSSGPFAMPLPSSAWQVAHFCARRPRRPFRRRPAPMRCGDANNYDCNCQDTQILHERPHGLATFQHGTCRTEHKLKDHRITKTGQ